MAQKDDLNKLYNALITKGYSTEDLGDENIFRSKMKDKNNRKQLYDYVSGRGDFRIGDYDSYENRISNVYSITELPSPEMEGSTSKAGPKAQEVTDEYDSFKRMNAQNEEGNREQSVPSPYVGKDDSGRITVFGVPYDEYQNMPKEEQSKVYSKAIKDRKDQELKGFTAHASDLKASVNSELKEVMDLHNAEEKSYAKEHPVLSFLQGFGQAQTGGRNQRTIEANPRYRNLMAAANLLKDSENRLAEASADKSSSISNFGRGVRDKALDVDTWTAGFSKLADNTALLSALDKANKQEQLTSDEEKLLDALVTNLTVNAYTQSDISRGYQIGETTAYSLPFMLEFIANPIASSGNVIAKKLLTYGLKKFGKAATSKAAKVAGRLTGDIVAATGMTATTSLPRVAADTAGRLADNYTYDVDDNGELVVNKTGNTSFVGAVAKSAASRLIENQSEMIFNAFRGTGGMLWGTINKVMPEGVSSFFRKAANLKPVEWFRELANNETMREVAKRAQFHGIGEEYLEEVYNNFANIPLGEMTFEEAINLDNNITTFLSLAPTQIGFSLLGLGSMAVNRYSNRKKMRVLFEKMTPEQQAKLTELTQMSKERGNEDIKKFIEVTIADKNLTTEQKKDEIEYAFELAKQNAIEDLQQEQTPEGRAADDAYVQGTELPVEQRYSAEQERVAAEEALREIDENALNTIDRMLADDASANEIEEIISGMDEDSAKLARDYYNKSMRINGIVDSARDDAEEAVASFEASLQEAIIPDAEGNGTITTATLMSGAGEVKEEVYVIANDGVQATILQKDGTKKMVNSGLLDNVQTSLANDVVQLYQDRIGEQMRDQTDMSLNHHPKTRVPQPGMQIWNGDMPLIITEVNADGSVRAFPAVLNNKTGLMEPKNGSTPVDMSAKESLDLQDDYYNKMDAASVGINLSEKEGENAIVSREGESKVSENDSLHPTTQEEKPVSLDETNGPTSNGNQPALLGINSPVVSENKDNSVSAENQTREQENAIPTDEKGNPLYHKVPVDVTLADLMDGTLTDEEVDVFIAANQKEADSELKKITDKAPKIGTNKAKYLADKQAWQEKVSEAQAKVDYWNQVQDAIKENRNLIEKETNVNALNNEGNELSSQSDTNLNQENDESREVESLSREGNEVRREDAAESLLRSAGDRTTAGNGRSGWTKESVLGDVLQRSKENQTWIEDLESIAGKQIGQGGENEAYLSHDGKSVIKVNDFSYLPDNSINLDDFVNRLDAHNELFPSDAITVLGFTQNSDGKISVVLSQPYISNAREATQEEIDSFLEGMDFYTDMSGNWTDGTFDIADTKPNNVLVDEEGILHFIDTLPYDSRKPGNMLVVPTVISEGTITPIEETQIENQGKITAEPVSPQKNGGKTEVKLPQSKSNAKNKKRAADIKQARYELMDAKRELSVAQATNSGYTPEEVEEKKKRVEKAENELKEFTNKVSNDSIRFREIKDGDITSFAQKYNLDESDVGKYAKSMNVGNLGGASYAFKNIKRSIRLLNSNLSLGEFVKVFAPVKADLYEKFGNVDALRDEYVQQEIEQRNVMEAARKRAEEEAETERKRLEEFELMTDTEMDASYFKALEENDEPRMRDIVNEAARRKGYVSADEFRMAHRAPSYDEEGYDKSMVDVANDKDNIRQSLNEQLKMNRDTYKDESASAINEALSAIDEGKHPTVTIYRAVPKSLKEGRVRNGDWVSLSESYVKTHGEHALNGDYRIIKEEVPAENLYWDGNDINEWGYDDRSDYRYKDTKNNRKLSDLITRDDNGNIIPPSKRFNARKADTRYRLIGEQETANLDEVTKQREIIQTVEDLSDKLNTPIHIARSLNEIPDGSAKRAIEEGRKVKAWFDTGTREVFFYIPNATDVNDAKVSILHEVVGHKGLRNLFGTENETKFDSMMMDLFEKLPLDVRSEIADMAVSRYASNVSVAMDEYLAEQAEKDETPGWWDRVVSAIRDFFRKMGVDVKLSENDVKYLLWRSRKKLETGDLFEQAKDVVMRNKLGIGLNETQETSESAPTESTRFREVEDEKNPLNKEMLSAWDNLAASTAFQLKETGVDYLTAVDKFTKLIADKTNSRVLDYENAYHALLALSSKNREEMNWYDSFVAKPLNDAIYNLVGGKKVRKRLNWDKDVLRDLVVYVESKHGIERNRQVAVENFINGYSFSSFKEIEQLGIPFDIDAYNKELKSIKDKVYKEAYDKAYDEYLNKYIDEGIEEKDASDKADKSAKNKADKAQSKASDSFRDKVKSDLTEKAREIMFNRWEEEKRNILNNTELTWLEKQTELDKAAALLGADLSKDYSGLSSVFKDSEDWKQAAYDNVLSYEGAHDKADLENLWSAVRNATNYALNKQLNTGLVSKEYVERQQKRFENYIPLRGFNDEIAGDVYSYLNNDVFAQGSPVKSMDGRTSEAGNPFGSILQIGYSSIAVGNKNIAKQRFYNFVSNHDTEGVAVVNNVWMIDYETLKSHPELKQISVKEEEEVPGMVEAVPDIPANATAEQISSILSSFEETMKELEKEGKAQTVKGKSKIAYRTLHGERSEHEIPLFIGGNRYVITITGNPRVAQAINGLTNPDSYGNVFEEFNKRMKRFMAGSFTSFNLPFAFANLSKDTMYANNQAFIRENRKWWWAFTKNQASYANPVNVAIMLMKYQKGTLDTNNKSERYFKEFMENGGATGYTFVETQKEYADKIGKILKELASGKKKLPEKLVKDYLFGSIEFLGQAAEVTNRYAAFRTSRELGRSISRSVNDAKDITVNFNRKGAGSKTKSPNNKTIVNLAAGLSEYGRRYILFWNAAMQSKYMLYKNLKEHPIKTSTTLIAGNIALGATIPFLNNMLLPALFEVFGWGSDDDKEDYYDVLTDYERQHNIMIRLPKGLGWFKFPLSPEFVPFYSVGDMITGSLSGKRKLDPLDIVKSAIDTASPLNIQWEYSGWKFFLNFLPTIIQPGAQNTTNVNFMGSPLAKIPINREAKNEPEFKNVFKNESPALIELSRLTNKLTGGDDVVRGAVSWNPAHVRNLITGYSGGWGGTFLSIADWMVGTANGEKQTVLASQTPFVSRFLSSGNKDVKLKRINSNYQDVVDFYSKIKHDERGYEKKIDETKDYFEQAEYQSKLNKLLDSEEYGRYQDLENIVETIKDQEELLKDDPDDEQLRDELYALKLKAIEIYHREKK